MGVAAPSENASKSLSQAKPITRVKLPIGVPPIPQLIETKEEPQIAKESVAQVPPLKPEAEVQEPRLLPAKPEEQQVNEHNGRHMGEQILARHEAADEWFKIKPGVQEVGDPHHIKNG